MKNFKIFFILLVFLLPACRTLEHIEAIIPEIIPVPVFLEPRVSLDSVNITGINFSGVNLLASVNVENPNNFPIPVPRIDWELFVNDAQFIQGFMESDRQILSRQGFSLDIPFSVSYEGLFSTFGSLIEAREAAYNVALALRFPIPALENFVYNLEFSGVLPIVQIPEISFQGITRRALGPVMHFALNWEIYNRNDFAFNIDNFIYDFGVNGTSWARGNIDDPPRIGANGRTQIPLNISISAAPIVRDIVDIINRGAAISYTSTGNLNLSGDLPGLEILELPMNLQGTTRIR